MLQARAQGAKLTTAASSGLVGMTLEIVTMIQDLCYRRWCFAARVGERRGLSIGL